MEKYTTSDVVERMNVMVTSFKEHVTPKFLSTVHHPADPLAVRRTIVMVVPLTEYYHRCGPRGLL